MTRPRPLRSIVLAVPLVVALGTIPGRTQPGFSMGPSEELSQPLPKRPPASPDRASPDRASPDHDTPAAGTEATPPARATATPPDTPDAQAPAASPSRP